MEPDEEFRKPGPEESVGYVEGFHKSFWVRNYGWYKTEAMWECFRLAKAFLQLEEWAMKPGRMGKKVLLNKIVELKGAPLRPTGHNISKKELKRLKEEILQARSRCLEIGDLEIEDLEGKQKDD